jgi:formate dehydrogenase major subunit
MSAGGGGAEIRFTLNGRGVTAEPGETLWQTAKREGVAIPHLCYSEAATYRPDGNCRACMVDIEGERALAASCLRQPTSGMVVDTETERAQRARKMVLELLLADQPERGVAPEPDCHFRATADLLGRSESRLPRHDFPDPPPDTSHPAMAVRLDSCILCGLCVRACREVQGNDVIGIAGHGAHARIVFDFGDPMGDSTCVGCGECVQACPTGALTPADGAMRKIPDKTVASVCPYCGVGCQLTYHVKDNKILRVDGREGPANLGRLCIKGRFGFDYVSHPHRLTVPLIRRDDVGADDVAVDPANPLSHFREATWDQALDRAAEGLKRIRDQHGGGALAGFGSAKGSNEEAYLFQKLVRTGFGTNNVDHCTRLCHASSVAALMETIGSGAVTAPFAAAAEADTIIVIGANPTVNHPVAATFIKNAARRGATLIVIDPRGQALARDATLVLNQKPSSDVALLNAIMHVILDENLQNDAYIRDHTEGFDALAAHLASFRPEDMATVCGIDADTIRAVARAYATAERSLIFWGMGISQHVHGTDNARCLISLALMCGHVGRPGTGLHPLRGQNNVQGASDVGLIPMVYPDYQSVADPAARAKFEHYWNAELDPEPGLTVVEVTDAIHRGTVRGMYIMGENPAMSDPNVSHARAGLVKLEHLVVQDIFLTETAAYADVILPASAFPEKTGTFINTDRRVQLGRRALDPPGNARQDLDIIQEIARRMGLDWHYAGPEDVFDEMRGCMKSIRGITWDRLGRESAVTYPCDDENAPGQEVMFGDGFPTPTGKGRFVPCDIVPPDDAPNADFPMILTTGRVLEHWHTGAMTRRTEVLDAIEPEAIASLSPADLDALGATEGDMIQVRTRRGAIRIKARLDSAVPGGVVFIPFCYSEAAANILTNDALDPFGKIAEVKFCAARLEKVGEAATE